MAQEKPGTPPRLHRARALVSAQGIRHSPLADQWFTSIGLVANRSQHDAAEHLSLNEPPECSAVTPVERLARRLPAYYAGFLVTDSDLGQPCVVRGMLEQGLSAAHRRTWHHSPPSAEIASLLAFGHVAIARRGFGAVHFDEALRQLVRVRDTRQQLSSNEELLLATACAARGEWLWNLSGPPDETAANLERTLEPLVRYAQSGASLPNRSLALLNAGLLARMGGPTFAEQAYELFRMAKELAKGTPAQACIEPKAWLFGASRGLERTANEPCVITAPL